MNVGLPSETIKNAAIRIKELERENAALRAIANRLIKNNGGPLQWDEAIERDSEDDYVMVKVQDFEALCAALDAAREETKL
jgi:hypothetical protein